MVAGTIGLIYSTVSQTSDYLPKVSALVITALAVAGLVAALFFSMTGLAIIAAIATAAGIYNVIIAWKFSSLLSLEQETEKLKDQCSKLQTAKDDLNKQAQGLEKEKSDLVQTVSGLEQTKAQVDQQLQDLSRINRDFDDRAKAFSKENDKLKATNQSFQEKIESLNEKVLRLIQQLSEWKDGMKKMGVQLDRFDTGIGELKKQGAALDGEVDELGKVLEQNIDSLGKQIVSAEGLASQQAKSLVEQNQQLQQNIQRLESSFDKFQKTYEAFDKEEDAMRDAQGGMAKGAQDLHGTEQKLQATRLLLEQETQRLQQVQATCDAKLAELTKREDQFNQIKNQLEEEICKLNASLAKKRQEREELQILLDKMGKKIEEAVRRRRASLSVLSSSGSGAGSSSS
jgi:chromosome segregation ATPase